MFAIAGHLILIVKKKTNAAAVVHWSSKKIERVVASSLAADTLAMQKLASNLFYVRRLQQEMIGSKIESLPCLVLIDNQDLFSSNHHIKACEDKRLLADIINIKQSIEEDKTLNDVRYVSSNQMLADCLTKKT